jgi:hypothetical protein
VYTPGVIALRPMGWSRLSEGRVMTAQSKPSIVTSVRLSNDQHQAIAALAAAQGVSISKYSARVLINDIGRSRPTMAAGAQLLAICHALNRACDAPGVPVATREIVHQQSQLVLSILRIHGGQAS